MGLHVFIRDHQMRDPMNSFDEDQMDLINRAKSLNIDYTVLEDVGPNGKATYSAQNMRLIIKSLIKGFDITEPGDSNLDELDLESELLKRTMLHETHKVFICPECGYEDSKYVPAFNLSSPIPCPHCKKLVPNEKVDRIGGCPMSMVELRELYKEINLNHLGTNGKCVKNIVPTINCKSGLIDSIEIEGIKHLLFSVRNQNQHKNLYKWVINYLMTGEHKGAIIL